MKKKVIAALCALLAVLLLVPVPLHLKDGGTVAYKAALYSVQKVHRLNDTGTGNAYLEGTIVEILGFEVYNTVE